MGKFIPNLSDKMRHLRELLRKGREYSWEAQQQQAFDQVKQAIKDAATLTLSDRQ